MNDLLQEIKDMSLCERMSELQTEHVRALTARDKAIERAHVPPGTVSGGTHTLPRGNKKVIIYSVSHYFYEVVFCGFLWIYGRGRFLVLCHFA